MTPGSNFTITPVQIPVAGDQVDGDLTLPPDAQGLVLFAHGSGSSRFSSRNRYVARELNLGHLATLLIDLLTPEEERLDDFTAELRFNIDFLAARVAAATDWLRHDEQLRHLPLGYFGASTGAAAALVAAAHRPDDVASVVSRGGRPDLAGPALPHVKAPTLLLVGSLDTPVIEMNQSAYDQMTCERRLRIIPGASHLFEEPGTLEQVAALARDWFVETLTPHAHAAPS